MPRRVLIIVNPAAGRSWSRRRRLARVIDALERRGCTVSLTRSEPASGETERLARDAAVEHDVIVAAGGDGTINAVANGIAGSVCALAVLPFGTANVLAREIGLPRRADRLAALIGEGEARPVWPGMVRSTEGERLFLTSASSGFDALTVVAVNPLLKRWTGRIAFACAILSCLARFRPCLLTIRVDGVEYDAATIVAANGRFYAGAFTIAPQARLDEPMLDLLLFRSDGRLAVLRYLAALPLARLPRRPDILMLRVRDAEIIAAEALPVQADGEIVGHLPARLGTAAEPIMLIRP